MSATVAALWCFLCVLGAVCADGSALKGSALAAAAAPASSVACPPGSKGPARVSIRYRPNNKTDLCLTAHSAAGGSANAAKQLIVAKCTGRAQQVFNIIGDTSPTCDFYMKFVTFEFKPSAAARASCVGLQGSPQDAKPGTPLQLLDCSAALQMAWNYPGLGAPYSFLSLPQLLAMDVARGTRQVQLARLAGSGNVWEPVAAG
ncbi:hypothetical protein OEZ86_005156 [Tetradesmus obliquus]|nr:hypothetical protein OEZ86_005156 [Tetradesmus obliquus]